VGTYSHSKLGTYEQCPQKYKFHYIDGIKTEKKTIEAFLGGLVHETLEELYADVQLSKINSLEEVIAFYEQQWEKNYTADIEVLRADLNPENYFQTGKRMIAGYYRRFHPFEQEITLDLELPVSFPLADGTVFTGYIDRVAKSGDHCYEIHDYKTSRHLPSQAKVDEDRQLPLYEIAIRHRWPDVEKVKLIWHYLAFETELETTKTPEELEDLKESTIKLIQEIENAGSFPPRESALCDWCEYYNICPAKQHEVRLSELRPSEFRLETGVNLVDRYVALKEKAKQTEKQTEEELEKLEQAILDYAEKNAVTVVVGTEKKVRIQEKETISLPTKSSDPTAYSTVVELLRQAGQWDKVSSFDGRAAVSALDAGELPEPVAGQLMAYLKKETKKKLSISRRDQSD
jgi:putative RecB family exonuclease